MEDGYWPRAIGQRGLDSESPGIVRVANVTILRVGTNQKYSDGWESAFRGKKSAAKVSAKKKTAKRSLKKAKK
jgi:hypothetical protein